MIFHLRGGTVLVPPSFCLFTDWFRYLVGSGFLVGLDRLTGQLNERQEKALLRMFREGSAGFQGGLSAGKYGSITGASPATTTRDLADLVAKGGLVRKGERRHARYYLGIPLRPVIRVTLDEKGQIVESR